MGEYAEMMLDGTCCEACGAFIGSPAGFPRYCCKQCEPAGYVSEREQTLRDRHRFSSMMGMEQNSPRARRAARHNRERHEAAKVAKPFHCSCGRLFRTENGRREHARVKNCAAIPPQERGAISDCQRPEGER